jgi:hypothetical protein
MYDAGRVGGLKRIANRYGNPEYFWNVERAACDPFFEGFSFE